MDSKLNDVRMDMVKISPQSYLLKIDGPLEFLELTENQIYKNMQESEEQIEVSVQKRWCSLFMSMFLRSLKSRNPKNQLLQNLLAYRKEMPSKQKKLEQRYVVALLRDKTKLGRDFKKQWLQFLSSTELKDLIQKNQKIQQVNKKQYIELIDKVIIESNSEEPFYKFMSKNQAQMHKNEKNIGMNMMSQFSIMDEGTDPHYMNEEEDSEYSCVPFQKKIKRV